MLTKYLFDNDFSNIFRELDEAPRSCGTAYFGPERTSPYPALNIYSNGNAYTITAELPGVEADKLEVTLKEDILTIKGSITPETPEGEVNLWRRERRYGDFERNLRLPFNGRQEDVEARLANGVLTLTVKKPAQEKPLKIEIRKE